MRLCYDGVLSDEHFDADALAAAAQGERLTSPQQAHLRACPSCTEALAALRSAPQSEPARDEGLALLLGQVELGIGDRVGRYRIDAVLGSGGMGVVFEARDEVLNRNVALKLVHAGRQDGRASSRLVREAQALAALSCRNVVPVFDAGAHEGNVFIAMELVRGCTLRQWQSREDHGWQAIVDAYAQAALGLAAAHRIGLVHRDFKPANALVDERGCIKVVDFGLVLANGESESPGTSAPSSPTITAVGAVMGTPAYMSPEQIQGHAVDARSDQFSLCVALWEALFGVRPFASDDVVTRLGRITDGKPTGIPERSPVPAALVRVLTRGLAVDPAARYPSIDALREDLVGASRPSRGRRWMLALAVMGLAAVVGVALAVPPGDACAEVGSAILVETGELAADASPPALREITSLQLQRSARGLVDAWNERRATLCSADASAVQLQCLQRARDAIVGVLSTVRDARRPLAQLADAVDNAACEGGEWAPRVAAIAAVLDRFAAVHDADDPQQREARIDEALDAARSLDEDAVLAEALWLAAQAHPDPSARTMGAFEAAARSNHPTVAAHAALQLARRPRIAEEEALQWLGEADAWFSRIPDAVGRAHLAIVRADVSAHAGDHEGALPLYEAVVAELAGRERDWPELVVNARIEAAYTLLELGRPTDALAPARAAVTAGQGTVPPRVLLLASAHQALGATLMSVPNPSAAAPEFAAALALLRKGEADVGRRALACAQLAAAYVGMGDHEGAVQVLTPAYEEAKRLGAPSITRADLAAQLAKTEAARGEHRSAERLYREAIAITESEVEDGEPWLMEYLAALSAVYDALGDSDAAARTSQLRSSVAERMMLLTAESGWKEIDNP